LGILGRWLTGLFLVFVFASHADHPAWLFAVSEYRSGTCR
jgi:hypothetical protein